MSYDLDRDYDEIIRNEEDEQKAQEIQSLFTQTFNTDAGKRVLEHLERAFDKQTIVAPESDLYKIGVRDGMRYAYHQIIRNIEGIQ